MNDPYVQENGTLKNKLEIKEYSKLNAAEKDIGFAKLIDIGETFKKKYDVEYLKDLHRHIFEDIFDWAGEFRTIPIEKIEVVIPGLSLVYSEPKDIEPRLKKVLEELNNYNWAEKNVSEIATEFTDKLAKLWRVHPFRDGNTRTTLAFAENYAREHGFPMDLSILLDNLSREYDEDGKITRYSIRDKFVLAALDKNDYPEPEHLTVMIKAAIELGLEKEKNRHVNILGDYDEER